MKFDPGLIQLKPIGILFISKNASRDMQKKNLFLALKTNLH
jgi:hypothetical protein